MTFSQLTSGTRIHVLEITGTFKKNTTATEKSQIVNMVKQSSDITTNVTKDFKELDELRAEVKELKQLLQNISTVRPEENNIDPPTEEKENEI